MTDPSSADVQKFADAFDIYAELAIPHDATQGQRDCMRSAFFAGAAIIIGSFKHMLEQKASKEAMIERVRFMESDLMSDIAIRQAAMAGKPN